MDPVDPVAGTARAVRKPRAVPAVLAEAITAVAVARSPTGNHRKDRTGGANVSTVPAVIERAILGNANDVSPVCMYLRLH